ncbi:hypothetical protein MPTK1_4g13770 [Marchantia polymorpha subsp. ruderalis]|uniref:Uncharacterized protein n=2 Tax=Marchantia polymorpha TaxID=3197 RepID=A0AAF6B9M1_MARPO|nr:hypothetical protein MARPO_0202s0012 [Marchantia polymorpha]BBN08705.1 hypothetical protein Mp_4g13770 [Marchantia polymorpha subsp. ruderalis]|eukprot:PTQ27385.1 hypothetical protein MARPO_0202s0012 [Marchantia polymorpha]
MSRAPAPALPRRSALPSTTGSGRTDGQCAMALSSLSACLPTTATPPAAPALLRQASSPHSPPPARSCSLARIPETLRPALLRSTRYARRSLSTSSSSRLLLQLLLLLLHLLLSFLHRLVLDPRSRRRGPLSTQDKRPRSVFGSFLTPRPLPMPLPLALLARPRAAAAAAASAARRRTFHTPEKLQTERQTDRQKESERARARRDTPERSGAETGGTTESDPRQDKDPSNAPKSVPTSAPSPSLARPRPPSPRPNSLPFASPSANFS